MELKDITNFGVSLEISKKIYERFKQHMKQVDKDYQQQLQKIKLENVLERELILSGARNVKAVLPLIELDEIETKGDDISHIKQKIKELKEDSQTSFLFFSTEEQGKNNFFRGMTPFESNFKKTQKLDEMDYEQLCYYYDNFTNL